MGSIKHQTSSMSADDGAVGRAPRWRAFMHAEAVESSDAISEKGIGGWVNSNSDAWSRRKR